MKRTRLLSLVLLLLFSAIWGNWLFAQISEGGLPPSFAYPSQDMKMSLKQPYKASINFSVKDLLLEDLENEAANAPLRTAVIIPTDLSIEKSGEWTTLPNGQRIWRLEVSAPKALALLLYYDEFYIPEGGKLFIYNADRNHVIGAYTNKTNPKNTAFATEYVAGDNIISEYVAPDNTFRAIEDDVKIKITGIGYGYNYIKVTKVNEFALEGFNDSGNWCMVNINCPEGDNWQDHKKGVARSITPIGSGSYLCSGTVINNTVQDLTPYYLTASHCFYDNNNVKCTAWDQIVYYFHYEHPGCENLSTEPVSKTMTGAQLLVELPLGNNKGSDGALLKLNNDIPLEYDIYYNGWDRTNTPATSGVGIHHTRGDVKKISTYTTPATNITWNNGEGATNAHWNVAWAQTVSGKSLMDQGSSGSPLFNQDGRVVGSLTGGPSTSNTTPKCDQPASTHVAYYGKLWYHWDNANIIDPAKTMASYLDPTNSGVEVLDGTYVQNQTPEANFSASSTDIYVYKTVTYTNYSSKAETFEWTFEGGTPASSTEKNPPVITYNGLGSFKTKLVINKGTADEREKEVVINVIEKGDNPVKPTASFATSESIVMKEGFDVPSTADFPPVGWTVTKPGVSANQWRASNLTPDAFTTIDPNSKYSAVVGHDVNNVIETWLTSSTYTLPEKAIIEFYTAYPRYKLEDTELSFHIIADGVTTQLWKNQTPEELAGDFGLIWHDKRVIDLSSYAGKDVQFTWRYHGAGNTAAIDGIKVYSELDPDIKVTINVGETISPVDMSAGPPILYEWTFPGGDPETSTEEKPTVKYMKAGTYDVTLKVKNYRGEDTRKLEGAVIVKDVLPEPAFNLETEAYTLTTFGPFAPKNAVVNITDDTNNYPLTWAWTFNGGKPATSAVQNPGEVTYETAGIFDLTFKAGNTAGEGTLTIPEFAKIGYETGEIWNIRYPERDKLEAIKNGSYYLTGTFPDGFGYRYNGIAERFEAPAEPGFLKSVDIQFDVTTANSGNLTVSIVKDAAGVPGTVLQSVALPVTSINTSGYTTVTFPKNSYVDGAFYIVVQGFNASTYNIGIASSPIRDVRDKNTAYVSYLYYGLIPRGWYPVNELYSDAALSLNVVPEFTFGHFAMEGENKFNRKNVDSTVGQASVKANVEWKATSSASWITLQNASGSGDGSFSFTVKDNVYDARKGFIKVAGADGIFEKYILVQQAGPNPTELFAEVVNEVNGDIELTWKASDIQPPYVPGSNIFDDAEDHVSFALDSPGSVGWSFIDGDGGTPYQISYDSEDYPNKNTPSSFIIYVPGETDPAITAASFAPRSGNKYFACLSNTQGVANNDWMISPELSFTEGFTFSFWAKSVNDNWGKERFRVAYSTTGKTQADFTNVLTSGNYVEATTTWTKFEYSIPADAKYVAINCVSVDMFSFAVDDLFIGIGAAPQSMHEIRKESGVSGGKGKKTAPVRLNMITEDVELPAGYTLESLKSLTPASFEGVTLREPEFSKQGTKLLFENGAPQNNTPQLESSDLPSTALRWDDGVIYNSIGFSVEYIVEVGIRFTPTDLMKYQGSRLKAVDIGVWDAPADGVTIKVRQGDKIVHTQKVATLNAQKFTRINFNKDLYIDALQDLIVTYEFKQTPGAFIFGVDKGPAIVGKGDLLSVDGSPFYSLANDLGRNYNMNVALLIEDNSEAEAELSYSIYRDGTLVGNSKESTYLDKITTDKACYEVVALYNDVLESTATNTACVTLSAIPKPVAITDLTATVADLVNAKLTWTESEQAASYNIYRDGTAIKKEVKVAEYLDEGLTPGDYCYTITVVNSANSESEASNEACINIAKGTSTEGDVTVSATTYDAAKEIYVVDCDATSVEVKIEAEDDFAKVIINNAERTGITLDVTKPGFYTVNYSIVSHDGSQVSNHSVKVEKRFDFNSVVITRWNNTLVVMNNPEYNGGYRFTSYRWFRNGQEIGAKQSYSAGKDGEQLVATDKYYVELTSGQFEGTLRTCEGTPTLKSLSVKLYPNPVKMNETVYLEADVDEELLEGAYIEIYNISGLRVDRIKVEGKLTPINIKSSALGTYVFVLKGKDGFSQNMKVVVNNGQK